MWLQSDENFIYKTTLKFFKKLELFQELQRLDKRNKDHKEWDMEKVFLEWAQINHFYLGAFLDIQKIIEILKSTKKFDDKQLHEHTFDMMQNLEEHGWAQWYDPRKNKNAIKINHEGMLLAEVISETNKSEKFILYRIFIILVWVMVISSIIIIIHNAIKIFL